MATTTSPTKTEVLTELVRANPKITLPQARAGFAARNMKLANSLFYSVLRKEGIATGGNGPTKKTGKRPGHTGSFEHNTASMIRGITTLAKSHGGIRAIKAVVDELVLVPSS